MPRLPAWVLAIAALCATAPAAAEVHELRDDGFIIRNTATVTADPMATWLALIKPGDWWSDEHTWSGDAANMSLTPQGGGCFCERIPGADGKSGSQLSGSVEHAIVVQASPLKMLRLRGTLGPLQSEPVTGILTFALKETSGGTQIQMEYNVGGSMRFKPAELAPLIDKVLGEQLTLLRDHLGAAGDAAPAAPDEEPSLEAEIDALAKEE